MFSITSKSEACDARIVSSVCCFCLKLPPHDGSFRMEASGVAVLHIFGFFLPAPCISVNCWVQKKNQFNLSEC